MERKLIALKIFLWAEVIMAARVLLFSIPVLLNKTMLASFSAADMRDWLLLVITFTAVFHLMAGLTAVMRQRFWLFSHYLACVLVIALTVGLSSELAFLKKSTDVFYFYPAVTSMGIVLLVTFMNKLVKK